MDEDRLRLRKKPHEYGVGRTKDREEINKFLELPTLDRKAEIAKAMNAAGLDETDIREFIVKNSLAGNTERVSLSKIEVDTLVWQFAKFWKADDPVGLLLVLSGNWKNFVFKALKWDVSDDTARGARDTLRLLPVQEQRNGEKGFRPYGCSHVWDQAPPSCPFRRLLPQST